ncbi:MAG: glycosyltransferase [Phycisphaeraceae bacterium]
MKIVMLGLSITSSWGNGHATIFRGLVRELVRRGHDVLFLERDVPWYASNRDLPEPPFGDTRLYQSLDELKTAYAEPVQRADLVLVGSYVPEGVAVGAWVQRQAWGVRAFYDIDTPVTLARLDRGDYEYLTPELIPGYDVYLSFTGGPTLDRLEKQYGSPMARPLYCCVDPDLYYPEPQAGASWDLGYMGTYSDDRQPKVDQLILEPARRRPSGRYVVAGPQYPESIDWPARVERIDHLPPARHRGFYNRQRFTLNVTRADMVEAGYAPSVRLFEAAACGTPIISDRWDGIETMLEPGREILLADTAEDVVAVLDRVSEAQRREIGERARQRVLHEHTAAHRARELEEYVLEARKGERHPTSRAQHA